MRERIAQWRITQRVMQPAGADPPVPLLRIDVQRVRPAPQLGDDALDMGATLGRHLRPCRQAHGVTRGSAPMPSPRTTLSRRRVFPTRAATRAAVWAVTRLTGCRVSSTRAQYSAVTLGARSAARPAACTVGG